MAGSNIFILYTDASGSNVTLSPRLGVGEVEPNHDTSAQVTLLEGTGISNGVMTANVMCANCHSWNGGTMDFSQDSNTWIYSYKSGDAINSNSASADLQQHDEFGTLDFKKARAAGGNSLNPFVAAAAVGASATNPSAVSATNSVQTASATPTDENDIVAGGGSASNAIIYAHAAMACIAFVILFPIAAIVLRVGSFAGAWRAHAILSGLGWLLFIAAFGLGIYIARTQGQTHEYHPIIGYILFALILFQPILGIIHHWLFEKHGKRLVFSHMHIWIGRVLITLGIINGGLGIKLADDPDRSSKIAYGVVAGFFGLAWIAASIYGELKRKKMQKARAAAPAGAVLDNGLVSRGKDNSEENIYEKS